MWRSLPSWLLSWFAKRTRSRQYTRACVVVGVLVLVLGTRIERAVKTSYDTEWTRLDGGETLRLPAGGWEYLLAATGPVAILLLLAAANIWHARERETTLKHRPDVVRTPKVLACIALALALGGAEFRWRAVHNGGDSELTLASLLNGASLLAVVGYAFVIGNLIYLRHGGVLRVLRGVFRRQRVNIAIVGALTFALMFLGDTSGQSVDSIRSWSPLVFGTEESPFSDAGAARLALGLAAALMFALALYESGTLLVRTTWANDDPSRSHLLWFAIAILLLGVVALFLPAFGPGIVIAGAILFVLYLLDWPKVEQKLGKPPPEPPVGVVRACRGSAPTPRTEAAVLYVGRTAQHEPTRAEAYTPEWIAITPLLALAATAVTATVEAALSTGWRDLNTWSPALPTVVLAVLAVVLTGVWPNDPHAINSYHRLSDRWLWLTVGILALTLLVFAGARVTGYDEWLLAMYGLLWLVVLVVYACWLFHHGMSVVDEPLYDPEKGIPRPRYHGRLRRFALLGPLRWLRRLWQPAKPRVRKALRPVRLRVAEVLTYLRAERKTAEGRGLIGYLIRCGRFVERVVQTVRTSTSPLVLGPLAVGGGVAVFIAMHVEPVDAGGLLGVFTLVFVGMAFALPFLHLAARATLRLRPPRLLWWFGMGQAPVLTLLLLWWIAVGVTQTQLSRMDSLHDARLVDRQAAGEAPTLETYFHAWLKAQGDLTGEPTDEPVPLVLVASHGGGIRAAYWAAIALDCIVAHSAEGVGKAKFDAQETAQEDLDAFRADACTQGRRKTAADRAAAAKRIFIASGVSGGAVGLYAYARQLIAEGDLGGAEADDPAGWIEQRLGHDFAAAAIGWALFHDVPNRLFGLHQELGGRCRYHVFGACVDQDRAAVLEEAFDQPWQSGEDGPDPPPEGSNMAMPQLRRTLDLRIRAADKAAPTEDEARATLVPLLAMNSTLTGGRARAVNSAANLGSWPLADAKSPGTGEDTLPLAGTVEIRDALCATEDMRVSTAALLAARFPYVTPSGRVPDECADGESEDDANRDAACEHRSVDPGTKDPIASCEGHYVDGGYTDNSGLATIILIWPSLRQLIVEYNTYAAKHGLRKVAPLIVELDNHYQKTAQPDVASGGSDAETLIPLQTAFGGRSAIETAVRAAAYRILPTSCTVTISPALHPGLIAPLGWELSQAARKDLRDGLTNPHPADKSGDAIKGLLRLERRLSAPRRADDALKPPLSACLPRVPCPADLETAEEDTNAAGTQSAGSRAESLRLSPARLEQCRKADTATKEVYDALKQRGSTG